VGHTGQRYIGRRYENITEKRGYIEPILRSDTIRFIRIPRANMYICNYDIDPLYYRSRGITGFANQEARGNISELTRQIEPNGC
jgi:hypothetical protein